ncbi:collagen alpha-1(I) chain-like [Dama dama]|uniref:collagen alpha-1(I) chain-like n=1 Tax=Dama dama TaxID=30532 RepID=UPI002A358AF8|nr:collagen alpha-1(I) chain-like [Dama dama]
MGPVPAAGSRGQSPCPWLPLGAQPQPGTRLGAGAGRLRQDSTLGCLAGGGHSIKASGPPGPAAGFTGSPSSYGTEPPVPDHLPDTNGPAQPGEGRGPPGASLLAAPAATAQGNLGPQLSALGPPVSPFTAPAPLGQSTPGGLSSSIVPGVVPRQGLRVTVSPAGNVRGPGSAGHRGGPAVTPVHTPRPPLLGSRGTVWPGGWISPCARGRGVGAGQQVALRDHLQARLPRPQGSQGTAPSLPPSRTTCPTSSQAQDQGARALTRWALQAARSLGGAMIRLRGLELRPLGLRPPPSGPWGPRTTHSPGAAFHPAGLHQAVTRPMGERFWKHAATVPAAHPGFAAKGHASCKGPGALRTLWSPGLISTRLLMWGGGVVRVTGLERPSTLRARVFARAHSAGGPGEVPGDPPAIQACHSRELHPPAHNQAPSPPRHWSQDGFSTGSRMVGALAGACRSSVPTLAPAFQPRPHISSASLFLAASAVTASPTGGRQPMTPPLRTLDGRTLRSYAACPGHQRPRRPDCGQRRRREGLSSSAPYNHAPPPRPRPSEPVPRGAGPQLTPREETAPPSCVRKSPSRETVPNDIIRAGPATCTSHAPSSPAILSAEPPNGRPEGSQPGPRLRPPSPRFPGRSPPAPPSEGRPAGRSVQARDGGAWEPLGSSAPRENPRLRGCQLPLRAPHPRPAPPPGRVGRSPQSSPSRSKRAAGAGKGSARREGGGRAGKGAAPEASARPPAEGAPGRGCAPGGGGDAGFRGGACALGRDLLGTRSGPGGRGRGARAASDVTGVPAGNGPRGTGGGGRRQVGGRQSPRPSGAEACALGPACPPRRSPHSSPSAGSRGGPDGPSWDL